MVKINVPQDLDKLLKLKAGDEVSLSGTVYTARDQAHKRLSALLEQGRKLPFDLDSAVIYYCGPAGTPRGRVIGSCGPTTSRRMDGFTPRLVKAGLKAMIGKGGRSPEVNAALARHRAVYLVAFAGCGALIAGHVVSRKTVAFPELGPEAVLRLEVKDLPLVVGTDSRGRTIF